VSTVRYGGAMQSGTGRRGRQTLLLLLVLLVIGMHHAPLVSHCASTMSAEVMSAVSAEQPEVQPSDNHCTDMGHDMVHPCLAVLWTIGGLLLLIWLMATVCGGSAPAARLRPPSWRVWRPPYTAGRALLTSVCVLRT
jgi:hypothetical protein